MHKYKIVLLIIIAGFISVGLFGQKISIAGFISDANTGEKLIGANVAVYANDTNHNKLLYGIATDKNGYFSIKVNNTEKIIFSYIGYVSDTLFVDNIEDNLLNIKLRPISLDVEGVQITDQAIHQKIKPNITILDPKVIANIPTLGSKADVLKVAQMMPGIQGQMEGSGVILVRGGNPGENLYIIDNVPLIYVNHLGGLISVFNTEMINNLKIYKGGFPARYGDKLSSVVDIAQKDGNNLKTKGTLNISVTDASFSVDGPINKKGRSTFMISGRKTLFEVPFFIVNTITKYFHNDLNTYYGFYDLNAKLSFNNSSKNTFSISAYLGDDYFLIFNHIFKTQRETVSNPMLKERVYSNTIWGNKLISGTWNCAITPNLIFSNTISYTKYRLKRDLKYESISVYDTVSYRSKLYSDVQDLSFRSKWKYSPLNHWQLDFGLKTSVLFYKPDSYDLFYYPNIHQQTGYRSRSFENVLYLENYINLFNITDVNLGIRAVDYINSDYHKISFEPRVNLNFNIGKNHSILFSLMRTSQNAHLLMSGQDIHTGEKWIPADKDLPSSYSDQISIGWSGSFLSGILNIGLEAYYKRMNNLVTYKEGFDGTNISYINIKDKLETGGKGFSKGIELLAKYHKDNISGFLAYTLSKTTRQYDNINFGKEFIFDFDRTHSLTLNGAYVFNKKWTFSASWIFSTGLPYTPILGIQDALFQDYETQEFYVIKRIFYGERNSSRMKPYHRMDVAAVYTKHNKKGRKVEWTFSIYNVYNRLNPQSYYYNTSKDSYIEHPGFKDGVYKSLKQYQVSFFPIIPSIGYKVYF